MEQFKWEDVHIEKNRSSFRLGKGGCASVILATWKTRNDKPIALKIVTNKDTNYESNREQLMKEREILFAANERKVQNVVTIFGYIEGPLPDELAQLFLFADYAVALMLEYIDGENLYDILHIDSLSERRSSLTVKDQIFILKEIASSLADMHILGITHGDLKSGNVIISDLSLGVKVIDFGLSRFRWDTLSQPYAASVALKTMVFGGTSPYCAPEMLEWFSNTNASPIAATRSSDMYAFGILAWEVLSRQIPFKDSNHLAVATDVLAGIRPNLRVLPENVPRSVMDMIESCWDKKREKRKTAIECFSILTQELEKIKSGLYDVFLSHSTKDKPLLAHVHRHLVGAGYRVWFDQTEMGHQLESSIRKGIKNSSIFLACMSQNYVDSEYWCPFEVKEAKKFNKPIFVLLLDSKFAEEESEITRECEVDRNIYADISSKANHPAWGKNDETEHLVDELNQLLNTTLLFFMKQLLANSAVVNSDKFYSKMYSDVFVENARAKLFEECKRGNKYDLKKIRRRLSQFPELLNQSIDKEKENATPLFIATVYNRVSVVKLLLQYPEIDVNKTPQENETPVMLAAQMDHSEIETLLLQHYQSNTLSLDEQAQISVDTAADRRRKRKERDLIFALIICGLAIIYNWTMKRL